MKHANEYEEQQDPKVAVIGLGYVGLPVATAFGKALGNVVGFDICERRVKQLRAGVDVTGEVGADRIEESGVLMTSDPADLKGCDHFIIAVPTPVDAMRRPDLSALEEASRQVGQVMQPGALVIYESTVYPGVTQEHCAPLLEQSSKLRCGRDFGLGYSPERINPGDRVHRFENVVKVVSGDSECSLARVAALYERVVKAGVYRAPSIQVAEASKVVENTQRDLNVALMNEMSMIFDRMDIDTLEVLAAARTKWNFLPFSPGLVGGPCIGVDPYYLLSSAEKLGLCSQVIPAGRRVNDAMPSFVVQRTIQELVAAQRAIRGAKVGVVGVTFKENVADVRNSQVPAICTGLEAFGMQVQVFDPLADPREVKGRFGLALAELEQLRGSDVILLAVPHKGLAETVRDFTSDENTALLVDLKGALSRHQVGAHLRYWRL